MHRYEAKIVSQIFLLLFLVLQIRILSIRTIFWDPGTVSDHRHTDPAWDMKWIRIQVSYGKLIKRYIWLIRIRI